MTTRETSSETLGARGAQWGTLALGAGVVGAAIAAFLGSQFHDGWARFQHAWLIACVFWLTLSLGAAERRPGEARDSLISRADEAMYAAKRAGRNRVEAAR